MATWLKKVLPSLNGKIKGKAAYCPVWAKSFPALHELLTAQDVDGVARQTATITLFAEGRSFKALLKDRETGVVTFLTADTLQGLLESLETTLQSGLADWREDKWAAQGKKREKS